MTLKRRGEAASTVASEGEGHAEVAGFVPRPLKMSSWAQDRTMRVVWGEEKLTPIPNSYSTVTVGPFEMEFTVPSGEDAVAFMDAANRELLAFVEVERERKVQSFINKLRQTAERAKGDR